MADGITLENTKRQKANTKVSVDGTVYEIGPDCKVHGLTKEHADKLLANPRGTWRVPGVKMTKEEREQKREEYKKSLRENLEVETGKAVNPEQPAGGPETPAPTLFDVDFIKTHESEDWPEPSEDLGMDVLRAMADGYEIDHKPGTKAATLVKKLTEAMYEGDDE